MAHAPFGMPAVFRTDTRRDPVHARSAPLASDASAREHTAHRRALRPRLWRRSRELREARA